MHHNGGILYLTGPHDADNSIHISNAKALVFNENGRCLARAQEALCALRRQKSWVCVAARGPAVYAALSLAAQLPVDRLALEGGWMTRREKLGREMNRLRAYACRNLALVVSEVLTFSADEREIRFLARGMHHAKICALPGKAEAQSCLQDWDLLAENNLLI